MSLPFAWPQVADYFHAATARRDDLAMGLLREFGWPFRGETPTPMAGQAEVSDKEP